MQTHKDIQVIILDDSEPQDRPGLKRLCKERGVDYAEFPYVNHSPAFARKFNKGFEMATGDAIVLLCSNWCLGSDWVERMLDMMKRRGKNCILCCDNARHNMGFPDGTKKDWYTQYPKSDWLRSDGQIFVPNEFREGDFMLIDEGFLTMVHRDYWLPWDEDFDPEPGDCSQEKGNWHGVSEWGYRMMKNERMQLWIKRDLFAEHLPIPPRADRSWEQQTFRSEALLRAKGVR